MSYIPPSVINVRDCRAIWIMFHFNVRISFSTIFIYLLYNNASTCTITTCTPWILHVHSFESLCLLSMLSSYEFVTEFILHIKTNTLENAKEDWQREKEVTHSHCSLLPFSLIFYEERNKENELFTLCRYFIVFMRNCWKLLQVFFVLFFLSNNIFYLFLPNISCSFTSFLKESNSQKLLISFLFIYFKYIFRHLLQCINFLKALQKLFI